MTVEEDKSGLHATTVQIDGHGVMIMGRSGAGKTELALTLIERSGSRGVPAFLVADDRTLLNVKDGRLIARVPESLAGGVEIRGAGLFCVPFVQETPLDLMVKLVDANEAERFPSGEMWSYLDISLPRLLLPSLSSNGDSNALSRAIESTLFYKTWP